MANSTKPQTAMDLNPHPVRWFHYLEYGLLRGLSGLFRLIGVERASAFMGALTRGIGPLTSADKTARDNLKLCMPELSNDEAKAIVREMWDNFGRTFAEMGFIEELADYGPGKRVEIEGLEHLEAVLAKGGSILFISGHFANWELISPYLRQRTGKLYGVYRPANNPLADRWSNEQRLKLNFDKLLPKGTVGARMIVEGIRQGVPIAMLVDQKMNDGIVAPFFGHPARTPSATATLSLKYKIPVLPLHIVRKPGVKFVIRFNPPLTIEETGKKSDDILALTTKYNQFLEDRIREVPGQWFWMHKRWAKPQRKKKWGPKPERD
ncbi:MAG: hypothetical protein EP340_02305 [Alphaproteobacteria bacterium]|nr:MAG: hypothetical protein EP340_02305 [Alphaproteobacteria bacterium]